MRIDWIINGHGAGGADVGDAEAAHTALCDAVRAAYRRVDQGALEKLLGAVYGLRLAMVTDGRTAIERGHEWTTTVGAIIARLSP